MNPTAPAPGVQNMPAAALCYNCGSNGHYFNACPEPTRNPPFGLAAAQAKNMAGAPAFKRQKTGNGPVVTRYPVPGPVITRYGPPPPQGVPLSGPQAPPAQYAPPQYPQQPLAPAHNFQQPQSGYGPQSYAPQPPYAQYGQYPAAAPQGPMQPYGAVAPQYAGYGQNIPPQNPYGYAAPAPYYNQQPQYPTNGYPAPMPGQYGPPQPPPQNTQYYSMPGVPQQPQPYVAQNYAAPPAQNQSSPFPQTQQYGPGVQPQYPYQPYQVPDQTYVGPQPNMFTPQLEQYSHPVPQQWQQSPGAQPQVPVAGHMPYHHGARQRTPINSRKPFVREGVHSATPGDEYGVKIEPDLPEEETLRDVDEVPQVPLPDGVIRPPVVATPIIDPFDLEWEESICKDYKYPSAVPISTPITLKHEEFPSLCKSGTTAISGKYVQPQTLDTFVLPIDESPHWSLFRDDPAMAPIDESCPKIHIDDWIEYTAARKFHLASLQNENLSPELARRTIEHGRSEDSRQDGDDEHHIKDEVVEHAMESSSGQNRQVSVSRHSRSRSRTPNVRSRSSSVYNADANDTWAPQADEGRRSDHHGEDQTEALLASLGVSGAPNRVASRGSGHSDASGPSRPPHIAPQPPSRHDSGYVSARPSFSGGQGADSSKVDNGRKHSWSAQNPPPPPPPPTGYRQRDYSDRTSTGYGSGHSQRSSRNHSRSGSVNPTPDESPLSPTSAALLGQIPFETETNERKRRRGDDHYVRRRPQPRVDEAFSRRW